MATSTAIAGELRQLWEAGQAAGAIRGALERWDEVVNSDGDWRWLEMALRSCGLNAEILALRVAQVRRRAAPPREWESLIGSVLESGDPWWARELLDESRCPSAGLQRLQIETELMLDEPKRKTPALIRSWVEAHRGDEESLQCALQWWLRTGRAEEAEKLLGDNSGLPIWRARFAVWRRETDVARAILDRLAPSPDVRCLQAIAACQEGHLEEAETALRSLTETEVRAEAWTWLATILRKQKRYLEAIAAADEANISSRFFNLVARAERQLAADLENLDRDPGARRVGSVRTVGDLELAPALYALGLRATDPITTLEDALERFGGNHTSTLTTIEQGQLSSYLPPVDPRHLGARAQLVLRTRGPAAARRVFHELSARLGDPPLLRIYLGELELWMGAYEEAARIFREILARDRSVRWAWIGLGASAMFLGDWSAALASWDQGIAINRTAGPTLYVYRGEGYRRRGEIALARRDLETAVREKPERLSARINLALLDAQPAALEQVHEECKRMAPMLMAELRGGPAEQLEQVLDAMRGNRSSAPPLVSYHLWGRLWHLGQGSTRPTNR